MVMAVLVFAGASFFFALAETALFSLNKWQVAQLAEKSAGAGKIVSELLDRSQDLQATLALGNTFANAAILAAALRMVFDARWGFGLTMLAAECWALNRLADLLAEPPPPPPTLWMPGGAR